MSRVLSMSDRVRTTTALWRLELLLQDLPGKVRRAHLAEVREHLNAAAADQGARAAVRQLGDLRRVADDYLDAEYGERARRPRWRAGLYCAVFVEVVLAVAAAAGFAGFMDGVLAGAGPTTTGTFHWPGFLGIDGDVMVDSGEYHGFALSFPVALLALPFAAFLLWSRAWRMLPVRNRHRRAARAARMTEQ